MAARTPISILQEYAAARKLPLPKYSEMDDLLLNGKFSCFCDFNGTHQAIGFGTTKKSAKHDSAQKVLDLLSKNKSIIIDSRILSTKETNNSNKLEIQKNYVGELNEFASKHQLSYPIYNQIEQCAIINNIFITECIFNKFNAKGCGHNKKDSKQEAAKNMLQIVKNCNEFERVAVTVTKQWQIGDQDFQKVAELYKTLSLNEQITGKTLNKHEQLPNIQICESIEELEEELKNNKIAYVLNELQRDPWVMIFQVVDTNFTLMGYGETEKDAIKDVLNTALIIKKKGFTFGNTSL